MCSIASVRFLPVAGLVFLFPLGAAEYVAANPEPTPEETLMVEYLNRFRADPKAEAERIAPREKTAGVGGSIGTCFAPRPRPCPAFRRW